MNGLEITQSLDTLKALSKVRFEGVVTDNLDNTLSDFMEIYQQQFLINRLTRLH